jgi:hypothetical protein
MASLSRSEVIRANQEPRLKQAALRWPVKPQLKAKALRAAMIVEIRKKE